MSEVFNQRSSVEGKIPSGQFNACFDLDSGSWAQDASSTKCLAMDGYFISLFDLRLDRRQLALAGHVLDDVPAAWDPAAIARYLFSACSLRVRTYDLDPFRAVRMSILLLPTIIRTAMR
jgi:hypothetical protein